MRLAQYAPTTPSSTSSQYSQTTSTRAERITRKCWVNYGTGYFQFQNQFSFLFRHGRSRRRRSARSSASSRSWGRKVGRPGSDFTSTQPRVSPPRRECRWSLYKASLWTHITEAYRHSSSLFIYVLGTRAEEQYLRQRQLRKADLPVD